MLGTLTCSLKGVISVLRVDGSLRMAFYHGEILGRGEVFHSALPTFWKRLVKWSREMGRSPAGQKQKRCPGICPASR